MYEAWTAAIEQHADYVQMTKAAIAEQRQNGNGDFEIKLISSKPQPVGLDDPNQAVVVDGKLVPMMRPTPDLMYSTQPRERCTSSHFQTYSYLPTFTAESTSLSDQLAKPRT